MQNQWNGGHIIAIQDKINRTPQFQMSIWKIFTEYLNLKERLIIRVLSKEHRIKVFPLSKNFLDKGKYIQKKDIYELARSVVKVRGWGYTCASCGNDAFVPVRPYFESRGGLCPSDNSIQCLRCCRDMFEVQMKLYRTHKRTCFNGCCQDDWNQINKVSLNWYGTRKESGRPRERGALAHHYLYKNMDQACIGNTRCDDCRKPCYTVINAALHIRGCHREKRPKRFEVNQQDEIVCVYITKQ